MNQELALASQKDIFFLSHHKFKSYIVQLAIIFNLSEMKKVALCIWNYILLKYGLSVRENPLCTCSCTSNDHSNNGAIAEVHA